jgi:ABC-type Fe3+/spermidine/putrescine transport system ATPase subunit
MNGIIDESSPDGHEFNPATFDLYLRRGIGDGVKSMSSEKGLELQNIHKSFGNTLAVTGVSFKVHKGEIVGILGPSGSGKTTLLEIIAGLIQPDQGTCTWDGKDLADIPPYRRGFGLMFQDFALFPHKNVEENIAFGLLMQNWPSEKTSQRVEEVLELVGLPDFGQRDVDTLSGGEQQRVALARSLAPQPRLLMLDEPIGSLDRTLRERLMGELREILKSMNQTALYVTHDQVEVFTVADRIVVIHEGKVAQIGTPMEIYRHPNSTFVAQFLGLTNLLEGEAKQEGNKTMISTPLGTWPTEEDIKGTCTVLLRPDVVEVGPAPDRKYCELKGSLAKKSFSGKTFRTEVSVAGIILKFHFPAATTDLPAAGEEVTLHFDPSRALQLFQE